MSDTAWYIMDSGYGTGRYHMALDTMLGQFPPEKPLLRFYQWKPYALSLGYGQQHNAFNLVQCAEEGIDVVRRPTGGSAVLHADEVTYSVVLPGIHPLFSLSIIELYEWVSRGIQRGLELFDIQTDLVQPAVEKKKVHDPICFADAGRNELLYQGRKLVGSAQRRYRTGILQHGSILLGEAHIRIMSLQQRQQSAVSLRSGSVGLWEILGNRVTYRACVEKLVSGFIDVHNLEFESFELTENQQRHLEDYMDDCAVQTTEGSPLFSV